MADYIRADLRRIYRRLPRLIVLAALYILLTIAFVEVFKAGAKLFTLLIAFEHYVVGFIPLVFGLLELAALFSDDLSAKTMQSAIGMGISRKKVVLCKLADMAIVLFLDILLLGLILVSASGIWGMGMTGPLLREFVLTLFVAWLKSVAYLSLSMILAFYTQNALFAMLAHIVLASGLANKALGMGLDLKALAPLHLDRFLLTTEANTFYTQMLLGRFNIGALIAVLLYIAAGVAATWYLFSGIELEL